MNWYSRRPVPTVDEQAYAVSVARYLNLRYHPAVVAILAYEDASGTGTDAWSRCPFPRRSEALRGSSAAVSR